MPSRIDASLAATPHATSSPARGRSGTATASDLRHFDSIKVVDIHVPALRDRRADVLALARVFLDESAARMNRTISGLSPAVADHLLRYDWPGNVRELENTMERAAALASSSRIEAEDLSEEIRAVAPAPSLGGAGSTLLEHVVKAHIMSTLDRNDGNQVHTARQLGIGSATLYRKLKSYGWSRHAGPAERLVDPEG